MITMIIFVILFATYIMIGLLMSLELLRIEEFRKFAYKAERDRFDKDGSKNFSILMLYSAIFWPAIVGFMIFDKIFHILE